MQKLIKTHQFVDLDAVFSAWLVNRFILWNEAEIVFDRNAADIEFDAVVDCGGVHDGALLRFDHHMTGYEQESAANLVYRWLQESNVEQHEPNAIAALAPLVELVHDGDLGRNTPAVQQSRRFGLHALISGWKANKKTDQEIYDQIAPMFEMFFQREQENERARLYLIEQPTYSSGDVEYQIHIDAPRGATQMAYEQGVNTIFYFNEDGSRGVVRRSDCANINVANAVHQAQATAGATIYGETQAMALELSLWFQHPAGWMSGVSPKGGDMPAPLVDDRQFVRMAHIIADHIR